MLQWLESLALLAIFFQVFSMWQHTIPCQKSGQGLDLLRMRKAKNPITLRAWTSEDVPGPVPCHLLQAASLSVPLALSSGAYAGEHISTSLELLVESMVSLLARCSLWGMCVSSRRDGQAKKSCSACWVGLSQVSAAISVVEQKRRHW